MRIRVVCLAVCLPLTLNSAEQLWEQAQRTQRAMNAQKAVRDYTTDYIRRETSGRNPPSSTWRPGRNDDYRRPPARAATPYVAPAAAAPVPGTTEYKLLQARKDPTRPVGTRANRASLIRFFQRHGFNPAEAESWADLEISVNEGFRESKVSSREASRPITAADQARMNREWEELQQKTRREAEARRSAENAHLTAVIRRTEKGEPSAYRELSSLGDYTSAERLALLEKAASLGDRAAVRLAFDWRYQNGGYFDLSRLEPWARILAEQEGYAPAATLIAEMLTKQAVPDLPAAVKTLEQAYAKNPDYRLVEPLVILYREGGPGLPADADQAMAWGEKAIQQRTLAQTSIDLIRSLPVTEKHAPRILEILRTQAGQADNKWGAGNAAADLAKIYGGRSEAWLGYVTVDQAQAYTWTVRSTELNPLFFTHAIAHYVEAGDFVRAQALSEAAGKSSESGAVLAAARFWAERSDGKADGARAEMLYRECLRHGDHGVRKRVGDLYRYGQGRSVVLSKAVEWYESGYAKQEISSVRALAECLFRGIGVARDENRALRILGEAAAYRTTDPARRQASIDAILLRMEQGSRNQSEDAIRALWAQQRPELERLASDHVFAEPRAQSLLGSLLVSGQLGGREEETVKQGWRYLELAAKAGDTLAETMVAEWLLGSWDKRPRGGHSEEDRERAVMLLISATKKGFGRAGDLLADAQLAGWAMSADEAKALVWYEWAIEHGSRPAVKSRINLLLNGKQVRDLPTAIAALETEAKAGDWWAQNTLGILLWRGEGVPQNTAAALAWLDQAAENGQWLSARSAAKIRMQGGPGLAPAGPVALDALRRYSEQRGPQAMMTLARLYAGDASVSPWFEPDLREAAIWFRKAYDAFPNDEFYRLEREEAWERSQAQTK